MIYILSSLAPVLGPKKSQDSFYRIILVRVYNTLIAWSCKEGAILSIVPGLSQYGHKAFETSEKRLDG